MEADGGSHKYDDIINLEHPVSARHPQMSLHDRAAQFSPFAALTGHEAAIEETARLTGEKTEMDEYAIAQLNQKLLYIKENQSFDEEIKITYFVPDEKKTGGAYVTHAGKVKKIDEYRKLLILKDETVIPMEQIREIEGEFKNSCGS